MKRIICTACLVITASAVACSSGDEATTGQAASADVVAANAPRARDVDAGDAGDTGDAAPALAQWSGYYTVASLTADFPQADLFCNFTSSYAVAVVGSLVYIGAYPEDVEFAVYEPQGAPGVLAANSWFPEDEWKVGTTTFKVIPSAGPSFQTLTDVGQYLTSGGFEYSITTTPRDDDQDATVTYTPTSSGLEIDTFAEGAGTVFCKLVPVAAPTGAPPPPRTFVNP